MKELLSGVDLAITGERVGRQEGRRERGLEQDRGWQSRELVPGRRRHPFFGSFGSQSIDAGEFLLDDLGELERIPSLGAGFESL